MKTNYFIFDNVRYCHGSVIEIKEEYQKNFCFCARMRFLQYNPQTQLYYFVATNNPLNIYTIADEQLTIYIKKITYRVVEQKNTELKLDPRYIEGIVSAWTWYILIMCFAIFIKGAHNVIILWIVATYIFFNWRNKKINGE